MSVCVRFKNRHATGLFVQVTATVLYPNKQQILIKHEYKNGKILFRAFLLNNEDDRTGRWKEREDGWLFILLIPFLSSLTALGQDLWLLDFICLLSGWLFWCFILSTIDNGRKKHCDRTDKHNSMYKNYGLVLLMSIATIA